MIHNTAKASEKVNRKSPARNMMVNKIKHNLPNLTTHARKATCH